MNSKGMLCLFGISLALMPAVARAGETFTLFNDDELTISTLSQYEDGYLYDQSQVSVVTGGFVSSIRAYGSSTINIAAGWVNHVTTYESSTLSIDDGSADFMHAYGSSSISISGSQSNVGLLYTHDSSSLDISGGMTTGLDARGASTTRISGGAFEGKPIQAYDRSSVDISGGLFDELSDLHAYGNSTVTFHARNYDLGSGLSLDNNRVLGSGLLSGVWSDGTPWAVQIGGNLSTILAIVEQRPGDANLDGKVDVFDLGIFGNNYRRHGMEWTDGDFTGDGYVGVDDLAILGNNYGFGTGGQPIPEPMSLALLAVGGLVLVRRR